MVPTSDYSASAVHSTEDTLAALRPDFRDLDEREFLLLHEAKGTAFHCFMLGLLGTSISWHHLHNGAAPSRPNWPTQNTSTCTHSAWISTRSPSCTCTKSPLAPLLQSIWIFRDHCQFERDKFAPRGIGSWNDHLQWHTSLMIRLAVAAPCNHGGLCFGLCLNLGINANISGLIVATSAAPASHARPPTRVSLQAVGTLLRHPLIVLRVLLHPTSRRHLPRHLCLLAICKPTSRLTRTTMLRRRLRFSFASSMLPSSSKETS